jgi:hypothetical protein
MKIFISGPMRGVPYYGFPAFDAARAAFEAVGFDVVTPADLDRAIGFDAMDLPETTDWQAEDGFDIRAAMRRNIDALLECDALVSLLGDHWSMGCGIERHIAERCNIQTFHQSINETLPELARVVQKLWTDRAGKGEA